MPKGMRFGSRVDEFMAHYEPALRWALMMYPTEYLYPLEAVPHVVCRMRVALERGSYSHHGHAFKRTCSALGIPHTLKAIEAFLTSPHRVLGRSPRQLTR